MNTGYSINRVGGWWRVVAATGAMLILALVAIPTSCPPVAASDNTTANITILQSDDLAGIDETLAIIEEDTDRTVTAMESMVEFMFFMAEMVIMFTVVGLALWKKKCAYLKFIAMLITFFIPLRWLNNYEDFLVISLILFLFTGYFFWMLVVPILDQKTKLSDKFKRLLKQSVESDAEEED